MKKIFALRKKNTDQMVYTLAKTLAEAQYLAGGKREDWLFMATHSISDYSKHEKLYQGIYNKTAKRLMQEGK